MGHLYDVRQHGADPSGSTVSTGAIQAAIDEAAGAGGGTVYVPPGRFLIGTITFRSRVRLHLELGSVLVASENLQDYEEQDEGHVPPEFPYVKCLFVGFDLQDVEVTGGGTIDGRGEAFMDYTSPRFDDIFTEAVWKSMPPERQNEFVAVPGERPTWVFFFRRCTGVRFTDVRIRDVSRWTFRFSRCEHVAFRGVHIDNDLRAPNSDGIHFTGCSNVTVGDCVIASGDDCIAITNYGDEDRDTANVTITGCVLTSHSACVRIGFKGSGLVEDVAITGCIFRNANRGVGIFAGEGETVRRVAISNCEIGTRLIAGTWWGKAEPVFITTLGMGGTVSDVAVNNCSLRGEQGIVLYSREDAVIRDIRFSNVRLVLASGPMGTHSGGTIDVRPTDIFRRSMPPLYAVGVEDLRIRDMCVSFDESAGDYYERGPVLERCRRISLFGYEEA